MCLLRFFHLFPIQMLPGGIFLGGRQQKLPVKMPPWAEKLCQSRKILSFGSRGCEITEE
jgi:hypothetical protein